MKLQVIRLKHRMTYHPTEKGARSYSRTFTEGMVFEGTASALKAFPDRLQQVSEGTPLTDLNSVPINGTGDVVAAAQAQESVKGHKVMDLNTMTVDQLHGYAEENEIDLGDATKKADIIAAIQLVLGDQKAVA